MALIGGSLSRQHARISFFAATKSFAIAWAPRFSGMTNDAQGPSASLGMTVGEGWSKGRTLALIGGSLLP
jgi:hypothetical protein